ncbi:Cysteine synthase [Olavius algarvensis spirochete endosymbiont]|uniref:cysteine synthase A n=1 Tax=Olavius algarvensis spirochete endosymbiont TaxID=260710 RepID=UPI00052BEEBB|nr:cysteine synthase A [Olavius algarvensis spirochete endosymbiont]KGM43099.1 cysteine synthase [Alkalispirochaeta odontotermitis]VDB00585.1 Cysteine synthase [Olavius algarvensis spirochete endosymbiont]
MLAKNISELIGKTPLVKLNRVLAPGDTEIYLKLESFNPMGSVKDRIGLGMIQDAEEKGLIGPDTLVVEPTSGNTGIALAFICAQRGYKLALTMPESMSMERRRILTTLGATLHLTPAHEGMGGAIRRAEELIEKSPSAIGLRQFDNPANPNFHEKTTGPEIWQDLDGRVDILVAGVGTGGTITGATRYLRKKNPSLKAIAVEPVSSPVLSGGKPGPHKIQGIGAGFVPGVLDTKLVDEIVTVNEEEAGNIARRLSKEEGIFVGISAGGNVAAALKIAARNENKGKVIVTIGCDTGERYLSTWLFQESENK